MKLPVIVRMREESNVVQSNPEKPVFSCQRASKISPGEAVSPPRTTLLLLETEDKGDS